MFTTHLYAIPIGDLLDSKFAELFNNAFGSVELGLIIMSIMLFALLAFNKLEGDVGLLLSGAILVMMTTLAGGAIGIPQWVIWGVVFIAGLYLYQTVWKAARR